ncbi:MAG: response regulator [Deltaproteobacteria bacterium]|nr:MAG: response regulator [Deltaproteobacteria bacterium]
MLKNLPLRQKLTLLMSAVGVLVLVLAIVAVFIIEIHSYRTSMAARIEGMLETISPQLQKGLVLRQKETVARVLSSFSSDRQVRAVFVWRQGEMFATYLRSGAYANDTDTGLPYGRCTLIDQLTDIDRPVYHFTATHFGFAQPIRYQNRIVGRLYLQSGLDELNRRLLQYFGLLVALLAVSALFSYLVARRLQGIVTEPIHRLHQAMADVSARGDFSVRVPVESRDEIGDLGESFNLMLGQLESRDRQLADYRHNLEDQVAVRTRELEETVEELRLARDRAEAANRAKSQFLANMSHEIRTPMIGVLGMTELLFNSGLNERQRKLAETVFKSGESLLEILNDLLDLSRIEAGRMELDDEPFDIGEVVEAVVALLREGAERKGLGLEMDLAPDLDTEVRGDGGRLRQILLNLVGNAIKFTDDGYVALRVRAGEADQDGTDIGRRAFRIEVEDTGIGIPPELQDRIFDSFVQADETMTRKVGGTGLGLAIVRQLVDMMGGRIHLESRPGLGTRFILELSFRIHQRPSADAYRLPIDRNRVLMISDDPEVGSLVSKIEALGGEVEVVTSGTRALSLLRRDRNDGLDLVLVDQTMAGLGGLRLIETMASDATLPKLPVVLVCPAGESSIEAPVAGDLDLHWLHLPVRKRQLADLFGRLFPVPHSTAPDEPDFPVLPDETRVLLVEDNQTTRDYVRGIFGSQEDRLVCVENGAEAVAFLQRDPVDLVLMDVQMPVMDGLEATRRIRATGFRRPIIALTARGFEEDIRSCLDAGMDAHLCKPFHRRDLVRVLERWLPIGNGAGREEAG